MLLPRPERQRREEASKAAFDEAKQMKHRLIWSVVLLVPLMYVSMGHMLTGKHMPDQPLTMVLLQVVFLIPIVVLNKKYFLKGISKPVPRKP